MVQNNGSGAAVARVLVGIPTINRLELVKRAIDSVLRQSFKNFDVIVSDNGSDEHVREQLAVHIGELNDTRIRFHQQLTNEGEYGQSRYFLSHSSGYDYFVMLHDDDMFAEEFLISAVNALEHHTHAVVFIANPTIIDPEGSFLPDKTQGYLAEHGRNSVPDGVFDVATEFLRSGFTPISGSVFRVSKIQRTSFATDGFVGNYPFECDVFLRLADQGAQGVFDSRRLLSFCFHPGSMRNYMSPMNNRECVERLVILFRDRTYVGEPEHRRRILLSRYYRALALLDLRECRIGDARSRITKALQNNCYSLKSWPTWLAIFLVPRLFMKLLSPLPQVREAPESQ